MMTAICPGCKQEYQLESNGKYQCGVCNKKFFLFLNGSVEDADVPYQAQCPNCKYEYEIASNGKYQCGVCGKKFFLFLDGKVEGEDGTPGLQPAAGNITDEALVKSRQFHTGDLILGHYRVLAEVKTANKDVVYRCFDEKLNEHMYLQDLFPDIAIASETSARFQKVDEPQLA